MKIKQFEVAGLAQYSYVVSSEGKAVVIDPMRDFDRYTEYARKQGLTIKYVTETHGSSVCLLALNGATHCPAFL
jgi:hydroxyacylglutathione hydrolase